MKPFWNKIQFDHWEARDIQISTNEYGECPIVIEVDDGAASVWATPHEARQLAAKLIEAADAVDAAGKCAEETK